MQLASISSVISFSMVFIATPWLALELTNSAASAGLVIAISAIPGLVLSPIIGSIIDKVGRRRMAIWSEILSAFATILIPLSDALWGISLVILITAGILRGVVGPGGTTARKSLVPDVAAAGKLTLERANSIHEAVFATGFAVGPALAAVSISVTGAVNTFYLVAFFALISGLIAALIRVREQHEENDPDENQAFFVYAVQGFKILVQVPSVLILMLAITTLALIYLPTESVILPAHFAALGNPGGLGLLISAMALASVFGALFFEKIHEHLSFSTILRIGVIGVPLAMLPMSQLPATWALIIFGFALGAVWGPLMPLLNTVIQRKIPANKRGRVFALEMTIWNGGPMLSTVAVGLAVDDYGVGPVYLFIALAVLASGILIATNRHVKELDT